jgi:hypothetical protein
MSDTNHNRSESDPVILYLKGCIAEDLKVGNFHQLDMDQALLRSYEMGYVDAKFVKGEWLFQSTPSGTEAYMIHIAERLSVGAIVAEA